MTVVHPVAINMVFVEMPIATHRALVAEGYQLSLTAGSAAARGTPSSPAHLRLRLCTFWSMRPADVDAFVARIGAVTPPGPVA